MNRRELLRYLAAAAPMVAGCKREQSAPAFAMRPNVSAPQQPRMPVIFLAHGAPPLLDDSDWVKQLGDWSKALPKPKAVLMVSAHWATLPAAIGATTPVPLVYDFYGFPAKYYETKYPAPPAPALAARVRDLLRAEPVAQDPERGLDHGAYVPSWVNAAREMTISSTDSTATGRRRQLFSPVPESKGSRIKKPIATAGPTSKRTVSI